MSALVLTTLLHYIPIGILALKPNPRYQSAFIGYASVMSISTTLSAVWHCLDEPWGVILYADYVMAAVWSIYSLYLIEYIDRKKINTSVPFEFFVGVMNLTITLATKYRMLDYKIWHSVWHILSAIKSTYIVYSICYS